MIKHIIRILVLSAALLGTTTPINAQEIKTVDFSDNRNPVVISFDETKVTLQPFFSNDSDVEIVALVEAKGFSPVSVREGFPTSSYIEREVAIGKLSSADPVPSVILGGFSGGAHCCATLKVVTPSAGKMKLLEFEQIDGGPVAEFPKDLDGDGVVEFVRQDDNFRYAFASGAGSFSPPKLFNIFKGQIVDVTEQPSYKLVWVQFAKEVRARCADRSDTDRNGACIALAAAGARLGQHSAFLKEAVANAYSGEGMELPEHCMDELVNYQCPAGKEVKFYTFESAANWFLQRHGYIR